MKNADKKPIHMTISTVAQSLITIIVVEVIFRRRASRAVD